jgi:signal transduction histidine kinase
VSPALDAVPGAVVTLSRDLRILSANRGLGTLAGRPTDELVGELLDVVLTPSARILFQTHVYPALEADGRVEEVFLTVASSEGKAVPVLFNATRTVDGGDVVYEALLVRILARARWEKELLARTRELDAERDAGRRLAKELEAAAADLAAHYADELRTRQFRDAFMGIVSHELRTPITTIYGLSRLLRKRIGRLEPDALAEHLHDLESEADRMRRLTEDLLVMSRAEAGRLALADEPLVIGHLVRRAVAAEKARSVGHEFVVEVEPGLPLVAGEELYVEQVIGNLLSNAAKYSPAGTTVSVSARAQEGGVAVRVRDQGPGLGSQSEDQLFELFYRAPDATRQASGAGIGLFVCRELISAMDGRMWAGPADPQPGAEFGFWLPALDDSD